MSLIITFTIFLISFGIMAAAIAGQWVTFSKAGHPGWACLIPIYNIYVMTQIARKPGWMAALLFIPLVNIWAVISIFHGISTNFGKSASFTVGLIFLSPIFFAILGFSDSKYITSGPVPPAQDHNQAA
jgi:hypothetical protein